MSNNVCMEGYERLAAAVVKKAVTDYKYALKRIRRHPHDLTAVRLIEDCERFFRDEIGIYTDLDGLEIMRRIREMAYKEMDERDQRKADKQQKSQEGACFNRKSDRQA